MQSQINMNIKQNIIRLTRAWGLVLTMLLTYSYANAQCSFTASSPACIGEPILFNCNSPGASNMVWDFDGIGSNNTSLTPTFVFNTAGNKVIKLTLKLANGSNCSYTLNVVVNPKPKVDVKLIVKQTQCFANNSFCFTDSSKSMASGGTICSTTVVFDDGTKYTFGGNGPRSFCHSFQDPAGGTYGMTVEVIDCNGCITKTRYNAVAIVQPSLGLNFTSPQPKRCDSVQLCVTNKSTVPLDSIQSFSWDWGDGKIDNGNKNTNNLWRANIPNGICHWFKSQGPNGGNFNTVLTVTTNFGCTEKFKFVASATNLIVKPVIIADFDSLCVNDATFSFKLKDGPIPQAANPLYIYELPPIPANLTRNWTGTHKFGGLGPYQVTFSFTHSIPGCGRTVYDTILVIGPLSIIEGSVASGMRFLEDTQRYQCVIKDTVHFYNFSKFYHNDYNKVDDDSLVLIYDSGIVNKITRVLLPSNTTFDPSIHERIYPGFNRPLVHSFIKGKPGSPDGPPPVLKRANQKRGNECTTRLWDFDDDYCEKCTTDTKYGINVGKNCKYSKDSLPSHWYTPWDSLYQTRFGLTSESVLNYSSDSGLCYQKKMWADDSVAIIRDTFLFYGNNALANKTKDSSIFSSITNKTMVATQISGPAQIDMTTATKFYLQAGDTVYIDFKNGLPPNRFVGPRYLTVQPGNTLVIKNSTDKALYNVWVIYTQDTIPLFMVKGYHNVWKKERIQGYNLGDSVNAAAHRQKFYAGTTVKCFNVRLNHKDFCHPLACEHEAIAQLALQPPSAKKLRKIGTQCLGGDQDNYGLTFILDDTKPGCMRTWAEINFDTALNKTKWEALVGANLTPGAVSMGGLPPINPPYQVPTPGYQINGPAGNRFSKQFTVDDIKDTITGYINVGLLVGNGMWPTSGANYPSNCVDTQYYPKFARFPILDNRFRIVKPKEGEEFTKICKRDTLSMTTLAWNRTYVPDVEEATWSLEGPNVGKYYNTYYRLAVTERYKRFARLKGDKTKLNDSTILEDRLEIVKTSSFGGKTKTTDSVEFRTAKVLKWHTEADITPVFDIIKLILQANKIDIYELSPAQLNQLIWNGLGTFGKPFTGSRGCLDTTGFGRFIRFYKVADKKDSMHFRDSTLLPIDKIKGWDGKIYNAYSFVPQYSGYYGANFGLRSNAPENCTKKLGTLKKVLVGFYGVMNYTDTILCHGQSVTAQPQFRYFNVYPELNVICNITGNSLLDCVDYWRNRISEAGNINREGYTRHDLNKRDDGTDPKSTFGGFPWSVTGLDNAPGQTLILGGGTGSKYYNQDTGLSYLIRTAASDSLGCKDTIPQKIYVTALRANFRLDQTRPQCNTIVELFDSSYIQDPCIAELGSPCDRIIKWTVDWGDKNKNSINSFFNNLPGKIGHDYTKNGYFWIKWRVETELGCVAFDSARIYIPGPVPEYDRFMPTKYCVGEKVVFSNLSKHMRADSSIWIWEFGDNVVASQRDTITKANDTTYHKYAAPGRYYIKLTQFYQLKIGGSTKNCYVSYPDTTNGDTMFFIDIYAYDTTKVLAKPMKVCLGDTITFTGNVKPLGRYTSYVWNFGITSTDTSILKDTVTKKVYATPGKYTVKFMGDVTSAPTTGKICAMQDSVIVEVQGVTADFDVDSTRKPIFCFNNTSKASSGNVINNRWSFYNPVDLMSLPTVARVFIPNGKNTGDYNNPQICEDYRDSLGAYWVCLEAESDNGCKDTICKRMFNNFKAIVRPPNVFTPNGKFDGKDDEGLVGNEVFNILIEGEDKYDLVIFDRWGVKVFESADKTNDWNGKVKNTGAECPDGTYYYILKYRYKGIDKDEPILNGIVKIIR